MEYRFLNKIKSPDDLKKLNISEVNILCDEIRNKIITTVSLNGGHLASNLGSVELTVAIHRAYNAPQDAVIFDVGHQCYTHKLLTGRYDAFDTIRKEGGISGFMRPMESEYDPFVTGHSSNSISAAYGIYRAKCLSGQGGTAVAVIGDGALTGGMAYEALNNVGCAKSNFTVILNDNKMSISKNVGAMSRLLTRLRNKPYYHLIKFAVSDFIAKIPLIGKPLYNLFYSIKELLKIAVYKDNFFKSMGLNYLGPVDGHNVEKMEELFKIAKSYKRPTIVHVVTRKGKGYKNAEENPNDYHGVSPFDINEGTVLTDKPNFSAVVGETLCEMAEKDSRVCAVTAAMCEGTGLKPFAEKYKNRLFDVGIAEQHATTFAAGLAAGGMRPYFAVYSSFLQRAYDQIIHDCAIANLPVKILVDRAGIVGADGESHQGIYDVSFLRSIPNMNIYSPATFKELKAVLSASSGNDELAAIRFPRGGQYADIDYDFSRDYTYLSKGNNICVLTYGRIFANVLSASSKASFDVLKLNKIYPVSKDVTEILLSYDKVFFFEETVKSGSIGELVGEMLLSAGFVGKYKAVALNNEFIASCNVDDALKKYGLDSDSVLSTVLGG